MITRLIRSSVLRSSVHTSRHTLLLLSKSYCSAPLPLQKPPQELTQQVVQQTPQTQSTQGAKQQLSAIEKLIIYDKDGKATWPPGSSWTTAHLDALNLVPTPVEDINQVLPAPIDTAEKVDLLSPSWRGLLAWGVTKDQIMTTATCSTPEFRALYAKLRVLMTEVSEDSTTFMVTNVLDLLGYAIPEYTNLKYEPQISEDIVLGPISTVTILDLYIKHTLKSVPLGFGFEHKRLLMTSRTSLAPQLGSQLLGLAQERLEVMVDPAQPVDVYVVEVRGRFFSFWKASFTRPVLLQIRKGETPVTPIPLFYHRPRSSHVFDAGFDFADVKERRSVLLALKTHVDAFNT